MVAAGSIVITQLMAFFVVREGNRTELPQSLATQISNLFQRVGLIKICEASFLTLYK